MTQNELRALVSRHLADAEQIIEQAEIEGRSMTEAEIKIVEDHESRAKSARRHLELKVDAEGDSRGDIVAGPKTRQTGEIGSDVRGDAPRVTRREVPDIVLRTAEGHIVEARSFSEPLFDREEVRDAPSIGECVLSSMGIGERRDAMVGGVAGDGGFLVAPSSGAAFLDLARKRSRLLEAGVLTVGMTSAKHEFAVLESDPVPGWRGEGKPVKQTRGTLGRLTLSAKSLAAIVKVSRELLADAENAGTILTNALSEAMAEALDLAMLAGDAKSAAPTGLLNVSGLTALDAGGTLTYDDFIDARVLVENLSVDPVAAIMSPTRAGSLAKLKDSQGAYLAPPQAYTDLRRLSTSAMPNDAILCGNFGSCVLGIREGVSVRAGEIDDDAENGLVSIIAHARGDFGVARADRIVKFSNMG